MKLYRIARKAYAGDLSGSGSRLYGGRWNHKGTPLVYCSESRALAALEYLVHVSISIVPSDLNLVEILIPDGVEPEPVGPSSLPGNWRDFPQPEAPATFGTNWARSNRSLLLRVPSAVVEQEFNVLINPAHPDFKSVQVSGSAPFLFERRPLPKSG